MELSPKRANRGPRAGPIWHYVALRGTTWHKSAPYIVVVRGFARSGSRASAWAKDQHDRSSAPHARSARGALTSEACETVGGRGAAPPALVLFDVWEDAENITNRTVKAPPKTGQNAAPGGISRPQIGTTRHKINPYM